MVRSFFILALTNTEIAGLLAIAGVITGSALNLFAQWRTERERRRSQTRSALRLVDLELVQTLRLIDLVLDQRQPVSSLADDLDTPTWQSCQVSLATGLKGDEWSSLREAYASIEALRGSLKSAERAGRLTDITREARGRIQKALDTIQSRDEKAAR